VSPSASASAVPNNVLATKLDPAFGVLGAVLIITGVPSAFFGHKNRQVQLVGTRREITLGQMDFVLFNRILHPLSRLFRAHSQGVYQLRVYDDILSNPSLAFSRR
jgi:hypothetical protein